jgi:hypothetical protein
VRNKNSSKVSPIGGGANEGAWLVVGNSDIVGNSYVVGNSDVDGKLETDGGDDTVGADVPLPVGFREVVGVPEGSVEGDNDGSTEGRLEGADDNTDVGISLGTDDGSGAGVGLLEAKILGMSRSGTGSSCLFLMVISVSSSEI